ncbi:carboxypeptidase regulatory-like domain-containing protein, partial [candidate division KSB1 bacterium]|nr:carboxypeptidase regulatory-like domain-containing protein [candidate division KSB1 bacterium]
MISRVLFLLLILPQFLFAKDLIIRGRVLNSDSTAIAQAEVIISGLSRTETNNEGYFVFQLMQAAAEKHFFKSGSDWFIEVIKGDFLLMEPADGRITIKHNYDYQDPHKIYLARKGSLALLRSEGVLEHVFKKRLDAAISAKDKIFARQLEIAEQAARLGLSEEKLAAAVDIYKESLRTSADLYEKGLVALDDANSANESTERENKLVEAKENFYSAKDKDEAA